LLHQPDQLIVLLDLRRGSEVNQASRKWGQIVRLEAEITTAKYIASVGKKLP
jgi:hypothetical protein